MENMQENMQNMYHVENMQICTPYLADGGYCTQAFFFSIWRLWGTLLFLFQWAKLTDFHVFVVDFHDELEKKKNHALTVTDREIFLVFPLCLGDPS